MSDLHILHMKDLLTNLFKYALSEQGMKMCKILCHLKQEECLYS